MTILVFLFNTDYNQEDKQKDINRLTFKENEMDLNIITSNLGVVHYIEDLLKDVIDKVKSR